MLRLGPDFATDLFEVATRDLARLRIKLSYKWQFDVQGDAEKDKAIFRVNDFIGYVCENLASRIRQVAAENEFETFHKNASVLIRRAIFGMDDAGRARKDRLFSENQLRIIDIDIKDIAPVDEKTALKLREVIDTNIQIQLDASRQEAQAAAELKRIRSEEEKQLADIASHRKSEAERQSLIELQNRNHQLETLSRAKVEAEAEAQLEKARVESEEALARAESDARASRIRSEAELERERLTTQMALERQQRLKRPGGGAPVPTRRGGGLAVPPARGGAGGRGELREGRRGPGPGRRRGRPGQGRLPPQRRQPQPLRRHAGAAGPGRRAPPVGRQRLQAGRHPRLSRYCSYSSQPVSCFTGNADCFSWRT
ncbi:hypothetical protein [Corallococcus sicarius]|nr:hypothetical protein [Corallococcus sicarius]